jgi:2-phosphoglycerate kinase
MKYVFIGGIPTAGKSFLAKKIADKTGALYVEIDLLREVMVKNPKLKPWVNWYTDQNEKEYFKKTDNDMGWRHLKNQSEAYWETIKNKVLEVKKTGKNAIFEGYNLLPHLVSKYFDFPGIYLTSPKPEEMLRRIKMKKRWGESDKLHRMEVKFFMECFDNNFKKDAKRHGYKCFSDSIKAGEEILDILS